MESDKHLDKKKFSAAVENRVRELKCGYLDAIVDLCEDMQIEMEDTPKLLSSIVKDKLEAEATRLRYIKGGNTLPV